MAVKIPSNPPLGQPFDLAPGVPNPAWTLYFQEQYVWLGRSSGTIQADISGNSGTTDNATGVTVIENDGAPNGVQQASPGVIYKDTASGIKYLKIDGTDNMGWEAIT